MARRMERTRHRGPAPRRQLDAGSGGMARRLARSRSRHQSKVCGVRNESRPTMSARLRLRCIERPRVRRVLVHRLSGVEHHGRHSSTGVGATRSRRLTPPTYANIFAVREFFRAHADMKKTSANLTRRESQIMEILYRRRRATVEEIRAELPAAPSPSSVRKLLDIMIDRGLLDREYDGPRFAYFPAVKPEAARRSALTQLVRTFFNDSPGSAMAALLDLRRTPLPDDEYRRLRQLLDQSVQKEKIDD